MWRIHAVGHHPSWSTVSLIGSLFRCNTQPFNAATVTAFLFVSDTQFMCFRKDQSAMFEKTCIHTHTTVLLLIWNMSGTTRVSRYQKGKARKVKTNLDLLEQEIVSGSGICWAICKSAPHPRQPRQHPTTQFSTGRMPFLPPNQQRQSTEGKKTCIYPTTKETQ